MKVGIYHPSIETKLKISNSLKGKMVGNLNPSKRLEVIEKIKQKAIERYKNEDFKQKQKTATKNYYLIHEHHTKGKHKSEEQKLKMSIARKNWYINNPELAILKNQKTRKTNMDNHTHCGERNANWYGGISKIYTKRTLKQLIKDNIKKRDGFRCQQCFRFEDELKDPLIVHHIDFNKINNNENNLITLCYPCHSQLSYNRNSWINHFKQVMIQRGIQ